MIADLKIVDDETATAFGQRFEAGWTLEAMCLFLERFDTMMRTAWPEKLSTMRFKGDGETVTPFDGDALTRLRREIVDDITRWEVLSYGACLEAGPFRLKLYPLGRDDLYRCGTSEPKLVDESPWHGLDPTPVIEFLPTGRMPLLSEKQLSLLQTILGERYFTPPGTKPDFGAIPALRFPHETFGEGLGVLRISLLTVPV